MQIKPKIERVDKPWGYELIWARTGKYAAKILHLNKGKRLSYQYHRKKDEAMYVVSGKLLIELGGGRGEKKLSHLEPGECLHLPPLTRHRLTAIEDSDIFEVSTPELDDVVRLEDDHGRIEGNKRNNK
jgi:mannose-6-phosphate isomerase